jgi:hypothetical protein
MTPLYNRLARFLPVAMTRVAMVIVYAALMVMILTFLISPAEFELVYLDLG